MDNKPIIEIEVEHDELTELAEADEATEQDIIEPIDKSPVGVDVTSYRHDQLGEVIRLQFSRPVDILDMTIHSAITLEKQVRAKRLSIIRDHVARQTEARSAKRKKRARKTGRKQRKRNRR